MSYMSVHTMMRYMFAYYTVSYWKAWRYEYCNEGDIMFWNLDRIEDLVRVHSNYYRFVFDI